MYVFPELTSKQDEIHVQIYVR